MGAEGQTKLWNGFLVGARATVCKWKQNAGSQGGSGETRFALEGMDGVLPTGSTPFADYLLGRLQLKISLVLMFLLIIRTFARSSSVTFSSLKKHGRHLMSPSSPALLLFLVIINITEPTARIVLL